MTKLPLKVFLILTPQLGKVKAGDCKIAVFFGRGGNPPRPMAAYSTVTAPSGPIVTAMPSCT